MDAKKARELTKLGMQKVVIDKYVDQINNRIQKAASMGKSLIHNPQTGIAEGGIKFYACGEEERAIKLHYENLGFTWTDHPDPDPGHPASAPYTTLSW